LKNELISCARPGKRYPPRRKSKLKYRLSKK